MSIFVRSKAPLFLALFLIAIIGIPYGIHHSLLWIENKLSHPMTIGDGTLEVQKIQWNQGIQIQKIQFSDSTQNINIKDLQINFAPLSLLNDQKTFINIFSETVNLSLKHTHPSPPKTPQDTTKNFKFPQFTLPFGASLQVNHFTLTDSSTLKNILHAQIDSIRLKIPPQKEMNLKLQWIDFSINQKSQLSHIQGPVNLQISSLWQNKDSIYTQALIRVQSDSLQIQVHSSKSDLRNLTYKTHLQSKAPLAYIPNITQSLKKELHHIDFKSSGKLWGAQKKLAWAAQLSLESEPLFGFSQFKWNLNGSGLNEKAEIQLKAQNAQGGGFSIQSKTHNLKKAQAVAEFHNLIFPIAHWKLPLDNKIHKLTWNGSFLDVELTTLANSNVKGQISFKNGFNAKAEIEVDPSEKWAYIWTDTNLQLKNTHVQAQFSQGELKAHLKTEAPYAYFNQADIFETDLTLKNNQIQFQNGYFENKNRRFTWDGYVDWNHNKEDYQFKIQTDSGNAQVWGDFYAKLKVQSEHFPIHWTPFKDSAIFLKYPAQLSTQWEHDFHHHNGNALIELSTQYLNQNLKLQSKLSLANESLNVQNFKLYQGTNTLEGKAKLTIPHQNNSNLALQLIQIQTQQFDLGEFSKAFADSLFRSGQISGNMSYDLFGLEGDMQIDSLFLKNPSDMIPQFPWLKIRGNGDSLLMDGRMRLGRYGEWDGDISGSLLYPLGKVKPFSFALATDQGGVLWTENGILDSIQNLSLNLFANGKWLLPFHSGELDNLKLKIPFAHNLKTPFNSMQIENSQMSGIYNYEQLVRVNFDGNANLKNEQLNFNLVSLDSIKNEAKINGNMSLNQGKINYIHLESPQYIYNIPKLGMNIQADNLNADLSQDSTSIKIKFLSPKIAVIQKDESMGSLNALLKADGQVNIPLGHSLGKNVKISANADLKKLVHDIYLPFEIYDLANLGNLFKTQLKTTRKDLIKNVSKPIDLDINIKENATDSVYLKSNIYKIPTSVNLRLQGTQLHPLLTGELRNTDNALLTYSGKEIPMDNFELTWNNQSLSQGILALHTQKKMKMCTVDKNAQQSLSTSDNVDSCSVGFEIKGNLSSPQLTPDAQCRKNVEFNAFLLGKSFILNCVPDETNPLTGKDLQNFLIDQGSAKAEEYINKTTNYIFGKGILYKPLQIHLEDTQKDQDSTSYRIPFSLYKDLNLIVGQTWMGTNTNTSSSVDYEKLSELTLNYKLWDHTENILQNQTPGILSLQASLISKTLKTTQVSENTVTERVEKNIGIQHQFQFWRFCLFGWGDCQ